MTKKKNKKAKEKKKPSWLARGAKTTDQLAQ